MGFMKKIAQAIKGEDIPQEPISFEKIDSYIVKKITQEEEALVHESEPHVENIMECVEELSQFLEQLREKEREDMFKRLDMIVKNAQKRFSDSLKNVVARIDIKSENRNYQDVTQFFQEVQDALHQMQKLNRMHGRSLYMAFDKEMKSFTKTIRTMAVHHDILGRVLRSEEKEISQLRDIHNQLSEISALEAEYRTIEKEEEGIKNTIARYQEDITQRETTVSELKSSEEYQRMINFEQRKKELEETLESTERKVYNILHPLDRDLRKFRRQVELGNISFDLHLLDTYEQLTEQFFKEEEGYPKLKKIARSMKDALQKQAIKEKGRKKEKVLGILEQILKDELRTYQKQYHETRIQLADSPPNDITSSISRVNQDIETKKDEIKKLDHRKEDLHSKKENIREKIEELKSTIKRKCSDIGVSIS
jgi:chromosome segregation ATPase